jgi:transposase
MRSSLCASAYWSSDSRGSSRNPAERLLHRLGIPQSDDTVVRIVKRGAAIRNKPALRVAGIDDWSWHQGRSYGTIVVDLERRQVLDVLRERSADMTAEWA